MRHVNIPKEWSGSDGLKAVAFLEQIIQAIWRAHGTKMASQLSWDYPRLRVPLTIPAVQPAEHQHHPAPPDPDDDDIPF